MPQDKLQFASQASRSIDKEIFFYIIFFYCIHKNLNKARGYFRVLFIDFLSVSNTAKPDLLLNRQNNFNINQYLVSWVANFLLNLTQYVKFKTHYNLLVLLILVPKKDAFFHTFHFLCRLHK